MLVQSQTLFPNLLDRSCHPVFPKTHKVSITVIPSFRWENWGIEWLHKLLKILQKHCGIQTCSLAPPSAHLTPLCNSFWWAETAPCPSQLCPLVAWCEDEDQNSPFLLWRWCSQVMKAHGSRCWMEAVKEAACFSIMTMETATREGTANLGPTPNTGLSSWGSCKVYTVYILEPFALDLDFIRMNFWSQQLTSIVLNRKWTWKVRILYLI